jgi:hypothetical protein
MRRIAVLLGALVVATIAAPAVAADAFTCPVTQRPATPFAPPEPYPRVKRPESFSWGSEKLWINIGPGVWRANGFPSSGKMTWWREGFDWRVDQDAEGRPPLKVTFRRLDAALPPMEYTANAIHVGSSSKLPAAMMIGYDIPAAGCYEVIGDFRGDRVTFVFSVE